MMRVRNDLTLDKDNHRITMTPCVAYCLGLMLMFQPNGAITIEPGKQLPQWIAVSVQANGGSREQTIHYMLFTPRGYQADDKKWPLMLFLHGLGECGDNELERVKIHGPAKLVESQPIGLKRTITRKCLIGSPRTESACSRVLENSLVCAAGSNSKRLSLF
jgi:hypothetical protein